MAEPVTTAIVGKIVGRIFTAAIGGILGGGGGRVRPGSPTGKFIRAVMDRPAPPTMPPPTMPPPAPAPPQKPPKRFDRPDPRIRPGKRPPIRQPRGPAGPRRGFDPKETTPRPAPPPRYQLPPTQVPAVIPPELKFPPPPPPRLPGPDVIARTVPIWARVLGAAGALLWPSVLGDSDLGRGTWRTGGPRRRPRIRRRPRTPEQSIPDIVSGLPAPRARPAPTPTSSPTPTPSPFSPGVPRVPPRVPVGLTPFQAAPIPSQFSGCPPCPSRAPKRKQRKKREPRTVCYRGTFYESARSTRKFRKEKIPCQ